MKTENMFMEGREGSIFFDFQSKKLLVLMQVFLAQFIPSGSSNNNSLCMLSKSNFSNLSADQKKCFCCEKYELSKVNLRSHICFPEFGDNS